MGISENIGKFKLSIKSMIKQNLNEDEMEPIFNSLRSELINNIFEFMVFCIQKDPPDEYYDDVDEIPVSTGLLYDITYRAYTGKKGNAAEAIEMNHLLNAYIERTYEELDKE
jgi:hypothetical protein